MASKYCDRVKSCKQSWWCADDYNPERDNHECFIQLTNFDAIHAMNMEELAEWIVGHDIEYGDCPPQHTFCDAGITQDDCRLCWLDWLKSKAEVET